MKKGLLIAILILLSAGYWIVFQEQKLVRQEEFPKVKNQEGSEGFLNSEISILTLFDNYQYDPLFETGWGFSCLVQIEEKNILFDTGADGKILLSNMKLAGVDPSIIDTVILSHIHEDHVGGLEEFLKSNSEVKVYIPSSFPDSMRLMIRNSGAEYVDVIDPAKIGSGVYTTSELGQEIKEQSLILDTQNGLVIITGCAHPGIVSIIKEAKQLFPEKDVLLVMGGFHLRAYDNDQLAGIAKDFQNLGVKKVAPSHCSGDLTRSLFERVYGERFIKNGAGRRISL